MRIRWINKWLFFSFIFLILTYGVSLYPQVMEFGEEEEAQMEIKEEGEEKPKEEELIEEFAPEEKIEEVIEVKEVPPLPIFAVQRIYAIKRNRFELIPRFGFSINDPYVQHYAFNIGFNWYITEVLAVGGEFVWYYFNDETDTNFHLARSYRLIEPINEYRFGAYVNFSYIPAYGKFALMNYWILYWDIFLTGGVGFTETRPIAAIDPEYRSFKDFNYSITVPIGIGGRLFLSRFIAVFVEIRGYLTPQKIENNSIGKYTCTSLEKCREEAATSGEGPSGEERWADSRANPDTWYGKTDWTFNIMFHAGLSIYLPPTFTYQLPK